MPPIEFRKFYGVDEREVDPEAQTVFAQAIKNFNISKNKNGLTKVGSYTDAASTLAGASMPNPGVGSDFRTMTEFTVSLPEEKNLYIFYGTGTISERTFLYVGPNWDIRVPAFVDGWMELTEHIKHTAGTGTTSSKIVVASGDAGFSSLNTNSGYYNGWILSILLGGSWRHAIVETYEPTGSTKTFNFISGGINGAISGDSIAFSRSPLQAINDNSAIGSPANGDNYADIPVDSDDKMRFVFREGVLIGMTGSEKQFPEQYQLWYGYINRVFGSGGNAVTFSDFWLTCQQLLAPDTVVRATKGAGGILPVGTYKIYAAYVYDLTQIGPLNFMGEATTTVPDLGSVNMDIDIPFSTSYDSSNDDFRRAHAIDSLLFSDQVENPPGSPEFYSGSILDKRCTALRIYIGSEDNETIGETPKFFRELRIASSREGDNELEMTVEGILKDINSNLDTFTRETQLGAIYVDDVGQSDVFPNFKYAAATGSHFIAANIRNATGEKQSNDLMASLVDGAGVINPDRFGGSNIINIGFYGNLEIIGVHVLGDEGKDVSPKSSFLVFTQNEVFVIAITSGTTFSFQLDSPFPKEGCPAPDSIFYAEGRVFYVSNNGFRAVSPKGSVIVGEGLKNTFDALTTKSDAVGAYLEKERLGVWIFPTDNKYFWVDLRSDGLQMGEFDYNSDFKWIIPLVNGGLLSTDGIKIYTHEDGTTQDGTNITPVWESKVFNSRSVGVPGLFNMKFIHGYVNYKSNTPIKLQFFKGTGSTALTFNNLSLPAQSNGKPVKFKFPLGTRDKEASIKLTIDSAYLATNTDLLIKSVRLDNQIESDI